MWFLLSFGTAFFAASSDGLAKYLLNRHSARLVSFLKVFWGSLFLLPLLFLAEPPASPRTFWVFVLAAIPLEVAASLMFQTAVQSSPLSITVPFLAFTPVFMLGLGWMFLGEALTHRGIAGILLVTTGAFFLQLEKGKLFSALRESKQKGPLLMLAVAFIFAITSVLAKKALMASSPFYFSGIYFMLIAIVLFPFQWGSKGWIKEICSDLKPALAIGLCEALAFLLQLHAFWRVEAAYVIAIKRLSLLLSVAYGYFFFKEPHGLARTIGAVIMVTGAVLIALA